MWGITSVITATVVTFGGNVMRYGEASGSCFAADEGPFPMPGTIWKNRTVWYSHEKNLASHKLRYIRKGMEEIESKTCVRFQRNDNEVSPDFIKLEANSAHGCITKSRGNKGGSQEVDIGGQRCEFRARILHMLMHVLGFGHIHNRPDRDYSVFVNTSNLLQDQVNCFQKSGDKLEHYHGHKYDFKSVLHYGPYEWAKHTDYPTLTSMDCRVEDFGNPNSGLSPGDIKLIKAYYCS